MKALDASAETFRERAWTPLAAVLLSHGRYSFDTSVVRRSVGLTMRLRCRHRSQNTRRPEHARRCITSSTRPSRRRSRRQAGPPQLNPKGC